MTTTPPGALQQATTTLDPTGGFAAGRRLMPVFGLPTSGSVAGSAGPAQLTQLQPRVTSLPQPTQRTSVPPFSVADDTTQAAHVGALSQLTSTPRAAQLRPALPGNAQTPGIRALTNPPATSAPGLADVDPKSGLRLVTSPINSWHNPALDLRRWTSNPNILQQTDPNTLIWALSNFGGPTTPEAQALTREWGLGTNDMGTAYSRLLDQVGQDKALYDAILGRTLQGTDSPMNRAFRAQANSPNGYTAEEWADVLYRTEKGFGLGLNPARNDAAQQVYALPDGSVGTRAQLEAMGLAPSDGNWGAWKRGV